MGSATQSRDGADRSAPADRPDTPGPAGRSPRPLAFSLGIAALGTLVLGVAWIVITGLLARSELEHVRAELPQLRQALVDGRTADARRLADRIAGQSERAHALTTGPAWWVAANLPGVGSPLQTTRVVAASTDDIGRTVMPTVVRLADEITRTRATGSTVDLTPIRRLAPDLHRAAVTVSRATAEVTGSSSSWFGPVSSARATILRQLTRVDGELSGADRAVRLAVPMLGGSGPRRYFIGFLNEAEARGVGGIPGAFAIATIDGGHLRFDHFGSDTEFHGVRAKVDLGPDYAALYGQDDPTAMYPNSDLSPDFRNAARIWAGLWQAKTGQRIDGAVALDPTALSYLLAVTGPARTASGETIDASNVVALTQRDLYRRYGVGTKADTAARKDYVVQLARSVSSRLSAGGNPRRLVKAVSRAATERRFVVWSADPGLESELVTAGWAGVVEGRPGTPTTGFVVNNAAGSKLDYYLDRSLTYHRGSCAASRATATFTLTNAAPTGLPPYVTVRADASAAGRRPGDNRLLVTYYASAGARIRSVEVDGKPVTAPSTPENGLPTVTVDLELPRGATRTITVELDEPAATAPVSVLRQPLVRPLTVHLEGGQCAGSG